MKLSFVKWCSDWRGPPELSAQVVMYYHLAKKIKYTPHKTALKHRSLLCRGFKGRCKHYFMFNLTLCGWSDHFVTPPNSGVVIIDSTCELNVDIGSTRISGVKMHLLISLNFLWFTMPPQSCSCNIWHGRKSRKIEIPFTSSSFHLWKLSHRSYKSPA